MPSQPSTAGIVTDDSSGQRHIPESMRADGTTRKAIKVRPGYRPPEDVEVYKNRTAEVFRNRAKGGPPGAGGLKEHKVELPSAASSKNAKRREARKKAKGFGEPEGNAKAEPATEATEAKAADADSEVEREKKTRSLKKKLKQAKDLQSKQHGGENLLPEQLAKVIKIHELIRELDALGFDQEGALKTAKSDGPEKSAGRARAG